MNQTGPNSQNPSQSSAVAIIPARFESSRLPGKLLLEITGKPMILWVVERALAAHNVNRVIVATDDERIRDVAQAAGYEAVMTSRSHASGTDRLAEVAANLSDLDLIVNVQGDEPLIAPQTIDRAIDALRGEEEAGIATTWEAIEQARDVLDPNVVKVVVDDNEQAVYFSRAPVPFPADAVRRHGSITAALNAEPELVSQFKKHTGLYVYRREALLQFACLPQAKLETLERLEQLRALEHGIKIKVVQAFAPSMGVDTPEDLRRVRELVSSAETVVVSSSQT